MCSIYIDKHIDLEIIYMGKTHAHGVESEPKSIVSNQRLFSLTTKYVKWESMGEPKRPPVA